MTNLLWPGDHHADRLLTDGAVLQAMVDVEAAWLAALAEKGLVPVEVLDADLRTFVDDTDVGSIAESADDGANPVIPLVAHLRARAPERTRRWIHRGLTSQDVLDTALMLVVRDAVDRLRADLNTQARHLAHLARIHRDTAALARTLTQPAIPTTFGVRVASWLNGVCDAAQAAHRLSFPIQIGGAAGTLAAPVEMATQLVGPADATEIAVGLTDYTADALGLARRLPWHTSRGPITSIGEALVGCTDAWGHIAADVITLGRPEVGELAEPSQPGRGGSSTMPGKNNPVLCVLLRRAALTAPPLASTLHIAASLHNDERADGAWHAEWDTLRTLGRRTVVAGSHATELLAGLVVHPDRMAANLAAVDVSGEQRAIASVLEKTPTATYLGAGNLIIDAALAHAESLTGDTT